MTTVSIQEVESSHPYEKKYTIGTILKFKYRGADDHDGVIGILTFIYGTGWNIVLLETGESWSHASMPGETIDTWTLSMIEETWNLAVMGIVETAEIKLAFEKE